MIERTTILLTSDFKEKLVTYGLPVDTWGQDRANALEDLIRELQDGETKLYFEDGKVIRVFRLLDLDVFYEDEDGTLYKLKEDRQEYATGRVRRRELRVSLMEKLKSEETGEQSIARALEEELGISGEVTIKGSEERQVFEPAYAYPGTYVDMTVYKAYVYLTEEQFKPEGYKEVQPGRKTTYFIWEKVEK